VTKGPDPRYPGVLTDESSDVMVILDSEERPWGSWHVIDVNPGYKIKRIHVNPGARLSLQSHEHRSEHWVVIQGEAACEVDGVVSVVLEGESIDVPRGATHRLGNLGNVELVIVEVQLGGYTGEDDICRYQDDYGRSD
jgi:mannose-6-phosphate isomerase